MGRWRLRALSLATVAFVARGQDTPPNCNCPVFQSCPATATVVNVPVTGVNTYNPNGNTGLIAKNNKYVFAANANGSPITYYIKPPVNLDLSSPTDAICFSVTGPNVTLNFVTNRDLASTSGSIFFDGGSSRMTVSRDGTARVAKVTASGAMYADKVDFDNCQGGVLSTDGNNGGIVYFRDSTFRNNVASQGAAVDAEGAKPVYFSGYTEFYNNTATGNGVNDGGALNGGGGGGRAENDATQAGGFIFCGYESTTKFDRNKATDRSSNAKRGGAISTQGNWDTRFCSCTLFKANEASQGGAIRAGGSSKLDFVGPVRFTSNRAYFNNSGSGRGGALYVASDNVNFWNKTCIYDNIAEYGNATTGDFGGGGIYIANGKSFTVKPTDGLLQLTNNRAGGLPSDVAIGNGDTFFKCGTTESARADAHEINLVVSGDLCSPNCVGLYPDSPCANNYRVASCPPCFPEPLTDGESCPCPLPAFTCPSNAQNVSAGAVLNLAKTGPSANINRRHVFSANATINVPNGFVLNGATDYLCFQATAARIFLTFKSNTIRVNAAGLGVHIEGHPSGTYVTDDSAPTVPTFSVEGNGSFTASNIIFWKNAGGAVESQGSEFGYSHYTNCQFQYNTAPRGGAVNARGAKMAVFVGSTSFVNNSATQGDGGALDAAGGGGNGTFLFCGSSSNVNFESNTALQTVGGDPQQGGALHQTGNWKTRICGCSNFKYNVANLGGAISVDGTSEFYFDGPTNIEANEARYTPQGAPNGGLGGGVYCSTRDTFAFAKNSCINGNTAAALIASPAAGNTASGGGGIFVPNGNNVFQVLSGAKLSLTGNLPSYVNANGVTIYSDVALANPSLNSSGVFFCGTQAVSRGGSFNVNGDLCSQGCLTGSEGNPDVCADNGSQVAPCPCTTPPPVIARKASEADTKGKASKLHRKLFDARANI